MAGRLGACDMRANRSHPRARLRFVVRTSAGGLKREGGDAQAVRAGRAPVPAGRPSNVAIQILSGSAEVLRQAGDDAIVLGTVNAGEFVGEMGVLEDRPRSATASHRPRR